MRHYNIPKNLKNWSTDKRNDKFSNAVMGRRVSCAWENHQFAPHSLLQPMKESGARKDFAK